MRLREPYSTPSSRRTSRAPSTIARSYLTWQVHHP
jgi:hypothetical protein